MKQTIEQLQAENDRLQTENVQLRNALLRLHLAAKAYWQMASYDKVNGSVKRYRQLEHELLDLLGVR